jgi:hypothetical protein
MKRELGRGINEGRHRFSHDTGHCGNIGGPCAYTRVSTGERWLHNLIGTRAKVGDRYEIRDGSNNLIGQENREGSRTIIRDGDNNKIDEIDRRGDQD